LHCMLDEGTFIFDKLVNNKKSEILTIEIAKKLFGPTIKFTTRKLKSFDPTLTLQILELLDLVKRDPANTYETEIMCTALCSTAINISNKKTGLAPINFRKAQQVYEVVQEWKNSVNRICGTFNEYKPKNMDRNTFVSLINMLYDCSAAELMYDINMQKAMNVLLKSDDDIATVSEQSGYTKKENFIAAFRNAYGVTPGHLKKQFR
ncbi:MAG: helix-turn-helix transcriptional regulator, partial [Chitinophagaceae bacterium]|nr:helix-turn-helix transcriptional regulator [Chitinophagaceae bacterium]